MKLDVNNFQIEQEIFEVCQVRKLLNLNCASCKYKGFDCDTVKPYNYIDEKGNLKDEEIRTEGIKQLRGKRNQSKGD